MMSMRRRKQPLGLSTDEAASYWLVRIDSGPLDEAELCAFEAWLAESPAHAEAFEQANADWNVFEGAEGDPHLDALRVAALGYQSQRRGRLWLGVGLAAAASLVAAVLVGPSIFHADAPHGVQVGTPLATSPVISQTADTTPSAGWSDFTTARGERRAISLTDGSVITLNTDSAVRVAYSDERRLIQLLRGQALFNVAKNKARPFVVQAGNREITALGTVFEVRRYRDRMKVTLVEGRVVVDVAPGLQASRGAVIVPTVLSPGQELIALDHAAQTLAQVDVDKHLLWRDGFVEFEDVALDEAVREMNRYARHELVIRDPECAKLRVSGVFRTGNPDRFAAILGELLPVQSRVLPDDRIEISSNRNKLPGRL